MRKYTAALIARRLLAGGEGQTLVEYAFIMLLVVIVVIAMVKGIGVATCNMYSTANSAIISASAP
jgi:Flp pilus assembly pilin Flp